MTRALRIAVLLSAAALAACGNDKGPPPGFHFDEPSAVAAFRGLTAKHADVHPYLAVANSGSNDLTIVDAADDSVVLAPVPLRSLVFPVPGRPALLASASLGDGGPDLLVAVSAGDSRLQVLRTWAQDGAVAYAVELDADVLALAAVPSAEGTARIAAALSGRRIAVAEFRRQAGGDAIEQSGVLSSGDLGFQPVALAAMPDGDPAPGAADTMLYAATPDLDGVVELTVGVNPPAQRALLDARGPTRLVAAARVAEALGSAVRDAGAFTGPAVPRVYAVLDEAGCGPAAPIACGLVALDPSAGGLVADPFEPATHLAPIPMPGRALALAAAPPPVVSPTVDPAYAGTVMRVQTADSVRATSGVAAIAGTDGAVQFVDLGRWEIPSEQVIHAHVTATVTSPQGRITTPAGSTPVDQWLVLVDPETFVTAGHGDAAALARAVEVTPGYTPAERWTVTYQGALPGLTSRRADAPGGGLLALQVAGAAGITEVVRLYDPTLGVAAGDTVVVDAPNVPGCAGTFEAEVAELVAPAANHPGGAVRLAKKSDPAHPEWDACVDVLGAGGLPPEAKIGLRATFLAGGYVLVKGTGAAAVHVGRPAIGLRFQVLWEDEDPLAAACTLPPAVPWSGISDFTCDASCRSACDRLVRARLARRIGYVTETCGSDTRCQERWPELPRAMGPALGFTLALENPAVEPPRGLSLAIETRDGRLPFRVVAPSGVPAVGPGQAAVYDRSPFNAGAGVRVLVPYASGVVLDATPTVQGGNPIALQ